MNINKKQWLTIIGIGEDGENGLSPSLLDTLYQADTIFGGERHLSFLKPDFKGQKIIWEKPFEKSIHHICSLRGQNVVVLGSGDPMHFGVGATLTRYIDINEMRIIPHSSSFSLAAARLGWALQDIVTLSVHGRPIAHSVRYFHNQARLLILSDNGKTPAAIAHLLREFGFSASLVTVLQNLDGHDEKIVHITAADMRENETFSDLNVVAIQCIAENTARNLSYYAALPDDVFLHDGQLTKQDIRAITLAHLAPCFGQVLWDVGAGCGSVGIEWLRLAPKTKAFAIEKNPKRQDYILQNAMRLGVAQLNLIKGKAPQALENLEAPDAIFIGGGFGNDHVFDCCWEKLKQGGRLVANAVTLETEIALHLQAKKIGAQLKKIQLSEAKPLGSFQVWRQALPVTMMIATKKDGF